MFHCCACVCVTLCNNISCRKCVLTHCYARTVLKLSPHAFFQTHLIHLTVFATANLFPRLVPVWVSILCAQRATPATVVEHTRRAERKGCRTECCSEPLAAWCVCARQSCGRCLEGCCLQLRTGYSRIQLLLPVQWLLAAPRTTAVTKCRARCDTVYSSPNSMHHNPIPLLHLDMMFFIVPILSWSLGTRVCIHPGDPVPVLQRGVWSLRCCVCCCWLLLSCAATHVARILGQYMCLIDDAGHQEQQKTQDFAGGHHIRMSLSMFRSNGACWGALHGKNGVSECGRNGSGY